MSEVKRYSLTLHKVKGKFESPEFERDNGEWVKFDDYASLKAEVERLTIQRAKLIKSAEELFRFIGAELYGPIDHFEADWEAAKEGKPSA